MHSLKTWRAIICFSKIIQSSTVQSSNNYPLLPLPNSPTPRHVPFYVYLSYFLFLNMFLSLPLPYLSSLAKIPPFHSLSYPSLPPLLPLPTFLSSPPFVSFSSFLSVSLPSPFLPFLPPLYLPVPLPSTLLPLSPTLPRPPASLTFP